MLTRAVNALEGLLVEQAGKAMMRRCLAQDLHRQKIVVDGDVRAREDGRDFVLTRRNLVVLGLRIHAHAPQRVIDLLHEVAHDFANGTEVMLLELLPLHGVGTKERPAAHDEVGATTVIVLLDEEVFLLGADGGDDLRNIIDAKAGKHALGLVGNRLHAAQKRGLLVEGLTRVGDERRGNAQHLVLDERKARGVPSGIATCLGRAAQAAARER